MRCLLKMEKTISKILDVSWRFGVTAASNDSDKVGKSFLQLKLSLDEGNRIKDHFIEMSIPEFYKFLHDLEKAKINLDLLV
ncbi:PREDICTED: COMM domain-containing protein 7-like isoform X2 [Polistes canadensis]|uniref:COMM domain-containing protein 7-like isoform X2 n=1 Tax=Polistes canadensis TaxID=91411 RepID=UPI0007190173|nr:PREDICTED: COMM domain-containing protein 7-like isoform X2 [Polistes canadensis]